MSDFIEFVAQNADNKQMGDAFKKVISNNKTTMSTLQGWFKTRGYDITLQECQELIDSKKNLISHIDRLNKVKGY